MFVLSQQRLKIVPNVVAIVILALIYYGTAEISRHLATTPQSVTPVWPPDGFAVAAVFIFGSRISPGVLIGSFLANIWAFFDGNSWYSAITSILMVLGIAIGTSFGSGIGNYLLRRSIKEKNPFRRLNDVYKFFLFNCVFTPMINATIGVVCLVLDRKVFWASFGTNWLTWMISNVAGICIFTPVILSFYDIYFRTIKGIKVNKNLTDNFQKEVISINLARIIELSSLIIIVIAISFLSFYQEHEYQLEYILIPCLVWAVIRFGQIVSTSLIVVVSILAVLGTVNGLGVFASKGSYSLLLLQSFIVVIVVTTLSLVAILAEKQQAIANLQKSKLKLLNKSSQLEESKLNLNDTALILEKQNIALTEAKQIAENANRTKTEFLSNMSHELRTPLNAILGFAQLLQESKNIDYQEKLDIQTIYKSGKHLLNLIDDILDISKIEAGKMELHFQDVSLSVFLKDLVDIIQVQDNQNSIDFICDFSPDLPQIIYTDAKRLRQVLLNLLSNAIKFTNKGHVIFKVKLLEPTKFDTTLSNYFSLIQFEIEDSGIGINQNKLESIFLPFEQVGDKKINSQGTGLGLAISQKIAEMMSGKITVSSQKDVGSVFRFTVSIQVSELDIFSRQCVCIVGEKSVFDLNLANNLPLKILIAEDNIVNQKVAIKILNKLGYKADIAINGVEVLELLQKQKYDVILMDVQMPEIDGIEATKQIIQSTDLYPRPYIIAMTANAMDSDRKICLDAGMDDYISKPVSVNLLVEALLGSQSGLKMER